MYFKTHFKPSLETGYQPSNYGTKMVGITLVRTVQNNADTIVVNVLVVPNSRIDNGEPVPPESKYSIVT